MGDADACINLCNKYIVFCLKNVVLYCHACKLIVYVGFV